MGFRYRKRVSFGKFVRLNLSGSGVSLGLGPRGANVNISKRGVRTTVGIAGSGLSWSETKHWKARPKEATVTRMTPPVGIERSPTVPERPRQASATPWIIGVITLIAIVIFAVHRASERPPATAGSPAVVQDGRDGGRANIDPASPAAIEPAPVSAAATSTQTAATPPAVISPEVIVQAQRDLARLGFDVGAPDGVVGKKTRAALRAFQKAKGLPVDGELTPELVVVLKAAH
jgi:putative peptidoglycan binding protein/uncharacterized protein DUF4236